MRVLVTGGTGFLGKEVLRVLLHEPRVRAVGVLTRRPIAHPDAKVKTFQIDLTAPEALDEVPPHWDHVVHLAGLYDLSATYTACYLQNVMATAQLIAWQTRHNPGLARMHLASSYAVGIGLDGAPLVEGPLATLPPATEAYALSKALAEQALANSGLPVSIYRLGILIGRSTDGVIEKIDGPYFVLRALHQLKRLNLLRHLPVLPIPAARDAILPLVPVDIAARAVVAGILSPPTNEGREAYYGIYNPQSVPVDELMQTALRSLDSRASLTYLMGRWGRMKGPALRLANIPPAIFTYVRRRQELCNESFVSAFPDRIVPHFTSYAPLMFHGLRQYLEGTP